MSLYKLKCTDRYTVKVSLDLKFEKQRVFLAFLKYHVHKEKSFLKGITIGRINALIQPAAAALKVSLNSCNREKSCGNVPTC